MSQQYNSIRRNNSPWYSRVFRIRRGEVVVTMMGLMLASLSAYFPYYVYNNVDEFGPPRMNFSGRAQADLEAQTRDELIALIATGSRVIRDNDSNLGASVDPITTASIDPVASTKKLSFELLFAASGQGLIQDGEDIIPVSQGSRLPDGSTVKSVRQRDGKWQIVTSNNVILSVKK